MLINHLYNTWRIRNKMPTITGKTMIHCMDCRYEGYKDGIRSGACSSCNINPKYTNKFKQKKLSFSEWIELEDVKEAIYGFKTVSIYKFIWEAAQENKE